MTALQAWSAFTDLADQAVVLPLALLVFVALLSRGEDGNGNRTEDGASAWRVARAWALAVGGVLLAVLALKLWAGACAGSGTAGVLRGLELRSPSGHTAAGGVVYGGLLALALRRGAAASAACCLACAAGFGASRLALGVHTPAEVALGCVVAAIGGAVLAHAGGWPRRVARHPEPASAARPRGGGAWGRTDTWAWTAAGLALVWTLHGRHLPAEPAIAGLGSAWLAPLCGG